MNRDEKLCKIRKIYDFCQQSGIQEDELAFLYYEMYYAAQPFLYEIAYADKTVSNVLDLAKEPVAVKLKLNIGNRCFWLRLITSFPQKLDVSEAEVWVKTLPELNGKQWRLPDNREMDVLLQNRDCVIKDIQRMARFFCLPEFYQIAEGHPDGRDVIFGCHDIGLRGDSPFFPGMTYELSGNEKVYWWPVCDAD